MHVRFSIIVFQLGYYVDNLLLDLYENRKPALVGFKAKSSTLFRNILMGSMVFLGEDLR